MSAGNGHSNSLPKTADIVIGKGKSVEMRAFRPNRFVENRPIKAEYEYVDD